MVYIGFVLRARRVFAVQNQRKNKRRVAVAGNPAPRIGEAAG
jgi:hypothetical protein